MITVVIAEDHQALIDGVRFSFEYEDDISLIGEANDGEALIALVRSRQPDIVITDIRMPKCDGICATEIIKKEFPQTKVIAFSMFEQADAIARMRQAGASGYIMKNAPLKKLLEAIRSVARKDIFYFDDTISAKDSLTKENIVLSSREKGILRLVGDGLTSQEIADRLFISKSTVDTHRKNILRKISIHGKTDLLRYAIERKYDFD